MNLVYVLLFALSLEITNLKPSSLDFKKGGVKIHQNFMFKNVISIISMKNNKVRLKVQNFNSVGIKLLANYPAVSSYLVKVCF